MGHVEIPVLVEAHPVGTSAAFQLAEQRAFAEAAVRIMEEDAEDLKKDLEEEAP